MRIKKFIGNKTYSFGYIHLEGIDNFLCRTKLTYEPFLKAKMATFDMSNCEFYERIQSLLEHPCQRVLQITETIEVDVAVEIILGPDSSL